MVRVIDILDGPHSFRLRCGSAKALAQPISAVIATEAREPRRLIGRGDLVVTTGQNLYTTDDQIGFVAGVAAAGGVGIGLVHSEHFSAPPSGLITAAEFRDIPLFEIGSSDAHAWILHLAPSSTRPVPVENESELFAALAESCFSNRGVLGLVERFGQLRGYPVCVVDVWSRVVASSPPQHPWELDALIESSRRGDEIVADVRVVEVYGAGRTIAYLCLGRSDESQSLVRFLQYLVAMEIERRDSRLWAERGMLGQVIEDLVLATISTQEAARRLDRHGIRPNREHAIVIGHIPGGDNRIRSAPLAGKSHDGSPFPVITAVVDGRLVAVLDESHSLESIVRAMHEELSRIGRDVAIGVSSFRLGATGLRWSYLEALQSVARGPGINERRPLAIDQMLLAIEPRYVRELGEEILAPVLAVDDPSSSLVRTLSAYLSEDLSVARTAERLFVHRNTIRYRLQRIEEVTGFSLLSTADITQLFLAIRSQELIPSDFVPARKDGSAGR